MRLVKVAWFFLFLFYMLAHTKLVYMDLIKSIIIVLLFVSNFATESCAMTMWTHIKNK